ncbi:CC0125/CC1285 family lipoprotein [Phenylobacterium sp.]|jgi:hypothetical protein|uniref:CC0125/CC1285 family lipoprotein n=1 Tax=Phenylobacterium sp. TaxID=1871053 RepID=UPI002E324027|nr:hypothetical protein [Phenylobacterium sp.]HEX4710911.1 hypothetical protein [Phenylobacterium sp.]
MTKTTAALVTALVLAAGLGACQTATPYQPYVRGVASSGGYFDTRIEPDRWAVTFAGNTVTSRETVESYLLFRAAELTLQNGYDWFGIVDRNTERDVRTYVDPDPFYGPWYGPGYGYWRPDWRFRGRYGWGAWGGWYGDPYWAGGWDIQTYQKFEASAEIVMRKGPKPPRDPRAFDARAVVENLRSHIKYPAPPK